MKNKTFYIASVAVLIVGLLSITTIIYWSGLNGPFLVDDSVNVVENYVDSFNVEEIKYVVTHNQSGQLGRPVSVMSFLFSGIVHGPDSWGYKYHNLMIHLINGMLILWLLIKLLPKLDNQLKHKDIVIVSGITTACWLMHPLMVSTVLYVVQRMAQLSILFSLLAILIYVFIRDESGKNSVKFYFLSIVAFPITLVLSLFSKENGGLIVFYILAIEFLVYRFRFESKTQKIQILVFQLIFSLIPVLLGSIYVITHLNDVMHYSVRDFTLVERLMTQLQVMVFYLKLILLPKLSDMSLFHDSWPVVRQFGWMTGLLLFLLIVSVASIFYLRKRSPVLAFGIAWFLVSHLMESTIFSLEMVFEHRNYLASMGPLFVLIYYCSKPSEIKLLKVIPVFLLFLLPVMTSARVSEWKDIELVYSIAVEEHPDSIRARTVYAGLLYSQGKVDEALTHIDEVIMLDETEFGSLLMKVGYSCGRGSESTAPLFEESFRRAERYPISVYGSYSIDALMNSVRLGICPEVDPNDLLRVIQIASSQKDNIENSRYLGFLQRQEGMLYYYLGDGISGFESMIAAYENTQIAGILMELVNYQIQLGYFDSAEQLIHVLEEVDRESLRSETFLINRLKGQLAESKLAQEPQ